MLKVHLSLGRFPKYQEWDVFSCGLFSISREISAIPWLRVRSPGCWHSQNRSEEIQSSHCSVCSFFLSCRCFTPALLSAGCTSLSPVFPTVIVITWLQEVRQGTWGSNKPKYPHSLTQPLASLSLLRSCARPLLSISLMISGISKTRPNLVFYRRISWAVSILTSRMSLEQLLMFC